MKANKSALVDFNAHANGFLDKAKTGDKIDRKALVAKVKKAMPTAEFSEMDGLNVLAVILKNRDDFDTVKGPQGGTFKK